MRYLEWNLDATKGYVNLYVLCDWHGGAGMANEQLTDWDFVDSIIGKIKKDPVGYWISLGDLCEFNLRHSAGSVFEQYLTPEDQFELIENYLQKIKDKCLGFITSNHSYRIKKETSFDPDKMLAKALGANFYGMSFYGILRVGKTQYRIGAHHGAGGGRTKGGKTNAAMRIAEIMPRAEGVFQAHYHTTGRDPEGFKDVADRGGELRTDKRRVYTCGSALNWDESYGERYGMKPAVKEAIYVTFTGSNNGTNMKKRQTYNVIEP
jgi:hypothetical protein